MSCSSRTNKKENKYKCLCIILKHGILEYFELFHLTVLLQFPGCSFLDRAVGLRWRQLIDHVQKAFGCGVLLLGGLLLMAPYTTFYCQIVKGLMLTIKRLAFISSGSDVYLLLMFGSNFDRRAFFYPKEPIWHLLFSIFSTQFDPCFTCLFVFCHFYFFLEFCYLIAFLFTGFFGRELTAHRYFHQLSYYLACSYTTRQVEVMLSLCSMFVLFTSKFSYLWDLSCNLLIQSSFISDGWN